MNDHEYAVRPNKSQQKREIKVLNQLGQELVKLPPATLGKYPLSGTIKDAITEAKHLTKGALQRQLRRIASLMQNEDVEAIKLELERQKMPSREQVAEQHLLESWRDGLVAGDEQLLTEVIDRHPKIDRQYVRQLVRNAQLEVQKKKPPKSSRLLFRYLSDVRRAQQLESQNAAGDSEHSNPDLLSD